MNMHNITVPYEAVSDLHLYLAYYEIKHTYRKVDNDTFYIFIIKCTDEQFDMIVDFASQLLHTL